MQAIESSVIDWYPEMSQAWSSVYPRGLLTSTKPGGTFTSLPKSTNGYIIRRDNGTPSTVINVFSTQGDKAYTIERRNSWSTLWDMYSFPQREQVASIRCGLFNRSVNFLNKPEIHSRAVGKPRFFYGGLPDRRFYLNDGAPYEWTRSSQYLERIINPGGGREEERQRIALTRLLRQGRFDWELIVDQDFDNEIALATAFISMLTAWTTYQSVTPGIRSS